MPDWKCQSTEWTKYGKGPFDFFVKKIHVYVCMIQLSSISTKRIFDFCRKIHEVIYRMNNV